jgi:Transposase DDE domain
MLVAHNYCELQNPFFHFYASLKGGPQGPPLGMNFLSVFKDVIKKISNLYHQLQLKLLEKATGRFRSLTIIDALSLALYWKTGCDEEARVVERFQPRMRVQNIRCEPSSSASHQTHLSVCFNKNAKRHKTMHGLAEWGHSGKGFYDGLKLHITTDLERRLLAFSFTAGKPL